MLFYTSIFAVSLIAALFAIFFHKVTTNRNRLIHISNRRVAITAGSRRYQNERTGFRINNGIPATSVHDGGVVSSNLVNTQPVKIEICPEPTKPEVCDNQNTVRLIREKRLLSMNESYKARCRVEPEPLTLEMVCKPFRREVAP